MLLRHAKAETPAALADEMRPLALLGRTQCARLARLLVDGGVVPDVVLVSTAVRTRQTWDLVRSGLGAVAPEVRLEDVLYGAAPREVVGLLRRVDPEARTVLVVGHEPTMSAVAAVLAGDGEAAHLAQVRTGLPTATAAILDVPGAWSELDANVALLRDLVRPPR